MYLGLTCSHMYELLSTSMCASIPVGTWQFHTEYGKVFPAFWGVAEPIMYPEHVKQTIWRRHELDRFGSWSIVFSSFRLRALQLARGSSTHNLEVFPCIWRCCKAAYDGKCIWNTRFKDVPELCRTWRGAVAFFDQDVPHQTRAISRRVCQSRPRPIWDIRFSY